MLCLQAFVGSSINSSQELGKGREEKEVIQ